MNSNIIPEMALRTKRGSINSSSPEAITPLSILMSERSRRDCQIRMGTNQIIIFPPFIRPEGHLLPREKVFLR
jgi:hypothetical protein